MFKSVVALLMLCACAPSFESACKDLCEKSAECSSEMVTQAEIDECKSVCEMTEREGQEEIMMGDLSQACYDATAELFACATTASCEELTQNMAPPRCADELQRYERDCEES